MPRVIKPGRVIPSEEVVKIPDLPPPPPPPPPSPDPAEGPDGEILEQSIPAEPLAGQMERILEESAQERAQEVSRKILENARVEREKLLEEAQAQAQQIRDEAWNEGYQQALKEKAGQIGSCIAQVESLMDQLQKEHQRFLQQYEEGLASLAVDIAEKVLSAAVKKDKDLMRPLVRDAVSAVKNADWISVQISDKLPGLMESLREDLTVQQELHQIEIAMADLPEDGCVIQTPEGEIDASLSVQMDNLKSLFEKTN